MTYKEAKALGYKPGDMMLTYGYVSRKVNMDDQEVFEAKGSRKGQLYILAPNWKSTTYCYRMYLKKESE